jgi:tetratricopeptide (TPR) repeat protein
MAGNDAFVNADYKKALELYSKAVNIDEKNYELVTCMIGAALNLGNLDLVFSKSDYLIRLAETKPQVCVT